MRVHLLCVVVVAMATDRSEAIAAQATEDAPIVVSTLTADANLRGIPILVRVTVTNSSTSVATVPRLSRSSRTVGWILRHKESGKVVQTDRGASGPPAEPVRQVQVKPGGVLTATFDIAKGYTDLSAGDYTCEVVYTYKLKPRSQVSSKRAGIKVVEPTGEDLSAMRMFLGARELYHNGKHPASEREFKAVQAKHRASVYATQCNYYIGHSRFARRDWDGAIIAYRAYAQNVAEEPLRLEALALVGHAQLRAGHLKEAEKTLAPLASKNEAAERFLNIVRARLAAARRDGGAD